MIIEYLFSSPEGDIDLSPEDLARPFLLSPQKAHPALTLEDYFDALKQFILADEGKVLRHVQKNGNIGDVQNIKIRSEKHGALYHLASVEVISGTRRSKFTVSTALSIKAKQCLLIEHDILNDLGRTNPFSYLPEIYGLEEVKCQASHGETETMTMLAAQWFENYHEWHLCVNSADGRQKLHIWDLSEGPRYATDMEAYAIMAGAAKILTLYYDFGSFRQIGAWHHAAGDFIVQGGGEILVKLTTVRGYEPLMKSLNPEQTDPVTALVFFFLHTTIQMRIDRQEGVGETLWADDFAVSATLDGFFEALSLHKEIKPEVLPISPEAFRSLLSSLSVRELERIFETLLGYYDAVENADMPIIEAHIIRHVKALHQALRDFH